MSKLVQHDLLHQLECSIVGTRAAVESDNKSFTMHVIEVSMMLEGRKVSWQVQRRFTEFNALREALLEMYPDIEGLPFPLKNVASTNPNTAEMRRLELQAWLRALMFNTDSKLRKCQDLLAFLNANPPPVGKNPKIRPRSMEIRSATTPETPSPSARES
eukprot:c15664_g1_i1.p1 GENE.c15664_g1_i1~~c15664_g1_i1.p1  ORF type:complete len:159 (+),score=17.75 c15664_g1_i1:212-688(+)